MISAIDKIIYINLDNKLWNEMCIFYQADEAVEFLKYLCKSKIEDCDKVRNAISEIKKGETMEVVFG